MSIIESLEDSCQTNVLPLLRGDGTFVSSCI